MRILEKMRRLVETVLQNWIIIIKNIAIQFWVRQPALHCFELPSSILTLCSLLFYIYIILHHFLLYTYIRTEEILRSHLNSHAIIWIKNYQKTNIIWDERQNLILENTENCNLEKLLRFTKYIYIWSYGNSSQVLFLTQHF